MTEETPDPTPTAPASTKKTIKREAPAPMNRVERRARGYKMLRSVLRAAARLKANHAPPLRDARGIKT